MIDSNGSVNPVGYPLIIGKSILPDAGPSQDAASPVEDAASPGGDLGPASDTITDRGGALRDGPLGDRSLRDGPSTDRQPADRAKLSDGCSCQVPAHPEGTFVGVFFALFLMVIRRLLQNTVKRWAQV